MKTMQTLMTAALVCSVGLTYAQVEINKPINLTGGSGERVISNLEAPVNGADAANKDYVDAAVAAAGGGSSIPTEMSNKSGAAMSVKDAIQYCSALVESGKDDWRLPTLNELIYFAGGSTDTDFLWTKTTSEYDISTNQNYMSVRLSDAGWSKAGIISRFLPRTLTTSSSSPTPYTDWTVITTVTPSVGDLLLLPDFSFSNYRYSTTSYGAYCSHRLVITFADGGTLTLGDYIANTSTTERYAFHARDMEEAWMFGPIQKLEVYQNGTNQGAGQSGGTILALSSAYEIILSQADSKPGLYARCVR